MVIYFSLIMGTSIGSRLETYTAIPVPSFCTLEIIIRTAVISIAQYLTDNG